MSLFSCPVCKERLDVDGRTYKCINNHCFDMAKEGYVNLLIGSKSTDLSGDDKEMVSARTRFLGLGFYEPLRNKVCDIMKELCGYEFSLLDAGCGEGYYTSAYSEIAKETVGVDISKAAIKHASKMCKKASFAAASVYHLPLADNSFDVVVNCFSPNAPDEFSRVLKNGGYLLYVVPGAKHLWELKSILYDNPYENEEKTEQYDGFCLQGVESVKNEFVLSCGEDVKALYHMTPYTWNTPKEGAKRLENVSELNVTADFRIHIFKCSK